MAGNKWRVANGLADFDWAENADFYCAMLSDGIDCDTPDEEEAEAGADAEPSPSPSQAAGAHGSRQPSPQDNSAVDEHNETESITSRVVPNLRRRTVKSKCETDGSRDRQCRARIIVEPNSEAVRLGNVTFGKSAEPGLLKNTEIGDEMLAKAGVPVKKRRERPRERASDRLLATRPAEHVNMSSIAPANLAGSCTATEPPQSTATLVDFDPLSTLEAIHSCLERDSLIEDDETFEVAQGSFELLQPAFQFSELTSSLFGDIDINLVTAIECAEIPTAVLLAPSPSPLLPTTHSHSGYIPQGELGCMCRTHPLLCRIDCASDCFVSAHSVIRCSAVQISQVLCSILGIAAVPLPTKSAVPWARHLPSSHATHILRHQVPRFTASHRDRPRRLFGLSLLSSHTQVT